MKNKLLVFFIVVVLLSVFCIFASADLGVPAFTEYLVTVTNPDGAKAQYDDANPKTIVVPKGTVLTVTSERYAVDGESGELILFAHYGDKFISLNPDDVKMNGDSLGISETYKIDEPFYLVAINEKGSALRKGPSNLYKKIADIPYGTEIICDRLQKSDGDYETWGYIRYNGKEGWINLVQYGQGFDFAQKNISKYTGEALVISKSVKLLRYPKYIDTVTTQKRYVNKYVSDEIPIGTVLKFDMYYSNTRSDFVYTEYNGVKGWLVVGEFFEGEKFRDGCAIGEEKLIVNESDNKLKLFSKPFNEGEFLGEYLDCNASAYSDMNSLDCTKKRTPKKEYEDPYYYIYTYRVTINGKTGWVSDEKICAINKDEFEGKFNSDINLYGNHSLTGEPILKIPANKKFKALYVPLSEDYAMYISYDGTEGWAENNNYQRIHKNDARQFESSKESASYLINEKNAVSEEKQSENLSEEQKADITDTKETVLSADESVSGKTTPKMLIITCVSAAVIICISAVALFIFINKKKKK